MSGAVRQVRTCAVCALTKEAAVWYRGPTCYACYTKQHRKAHPEKYRQRDARRWREDPRRRATDRARHQRHKERRNALCRAYRARNLTSLRAYDRTRSKEDPQRREWLRQYREEHKERQNALKRARYPLHRHKYIAWANARRAHKGLATPRWLSAEQRAEIFSFYKNRPPGYEVDHIVPLQGKNVSGLHVPWNLQYLPAAENRRKGNKL